MKTPIISAQQEEVEAIIAAPQHATEPTEPTDPTDPTEEEKKEETPENDEDDVNRDDEKTPVPESEPQEFNPPCRMDYGTIGRPILLRANYFRLQMPPIQVQHYNVSIVPDVARRVNREVIGKLVNSFSKYFVNACPVYDGRCNMYTRNRLPIGSDNIFFEVTLSNETQPFSVTLTYAGTIDTTHIDEDARANRPFLSPDATHAVDAILRHISSIKYFPIGRCFFSPPGPNALGCPSTGSSTTLGHARELWFGFHQSLQQTQWKLMVNIDTTTTAFYKSMPVLEFLASVLELPIQALNHRVPLSDAQRIRFTREIKNMKIEITHCGNARRKYRVCNVTRKPVHTQTFPLELEERIIDMTVEKYFLDKYQMELKYPHLPCLHVGNEKKFTYLPLEVCQIVSGQRCNKKLSDAQTSLMIRASQKNAPEREAEILGLVHKSQICADPFIKDYGITVSPTMTEVKGRVLSAPKLLYGVNSRQRHYQSVLPQGGTWDMRGKQLHSGIQVDTWALISFAQQSLVKESDLRTFAVDLQRVSSDAGMPISSLPCFCKYASGVEHVEPMFKYIKSLYPSIQIIVVVLPGKTTIYSEVKKVGDTILGIPTQCIALRNVVKTATQSLSNLCLKMNVKMGGTNTVIVPTFRPKIFDEPVIFIGADVSHPQAGESVNRRPTICALVASMDAHPSRYAATVRLQTARQEVMGDLTDMIRELLVKFRRSTGFRPMRIVMYRTGVSEGQYYNVLQYELRAIREACMSLEKDYHPGVTFMAVQKRHHTRLFSANPKDYTGKANNVPAGTTVDIGITHPSQNDFFLCSHAGIQGTSRPSRYHVLWDDNKLCADDLQQLTYQLCHTYVRCTRSVSIPAPAYYAHLVAFRARYHLADRSAESSFVESLYSTTSSEMSTTMNQMTKAVKVHPDASDVMYYA